MARQKPLRISLIVLLSGSILTCVYASASGQNSTILRGQTVRVNRPDSTGQAVWSTGRVVYASSDRLLLAETDGDPLVRFNEALRLQIQRSHSKSWLGGVLGFGVGAFGGWQIGNTVGGQTDETTGSVIGALFGGFAGAALGTLVGDRIRSTRWEEVDLEGGRITSSSLDTPHTGPDVPRFGSYQWTEFDPTAANFQAFFRRHEQDLHPVEGIWARHASRMRVAIVRVGGPNEDNFAAFTIVHPPGRPQRRDDGVMLFALELYADGDGGDKLYVRFPGGSPTRFRARADEWMLELEYPNGWWDRWEKMFPE